MIPGDLTTLANVKAWLNVTSGVNTDDALLSRLISAQSRFIQSWLNRNIASRPYTETRDGSGMGAGRYTMMFDNYPVTAVSSLKVANIVIPASPDGGVLQPGYGFDDTQLWLAPNGTVLGWVGFNGYELSRGRRNVQVSYTAGFLVLPPTSVLNNDSAGLLPAEQQTIPASPFQLSTNLTWLSDNGVWFVVGLVPLVKVGSSPTAGQYSVDANGVYTFAAADTGLGVLLSYSYVPSDIEQACIELVALRYKEKGRIGEISKAVGTETISYSQKDMPSDVQTLLNQYRKVYAF